ncbi:hypothetical protein KOW79_020522 [Hemibagrus wyckioides]|uniref:Knl1 C-terminal RWD domain-containing protein n=1 Tax=Hemibagrus wyckioides TaxID=337641 RepID=A0A9D3N327_9TELE|nr:kinetochore scaffold 1 [Hemibagrus wyckioides]KAG7315656.1 hypothetical protein KOW79_020522 [Hemibagrus wyckioides]
MEQKEAQNLGHDREGSSKRRISSILKAPRTSMKVFGNDQDENQEETRPIEKRRNSRRVSFATTNNVRVFPKDIKTDPVLTPIQNVAVGTHEGQNERMLCSDTSMGLDTMLTQPFRFELNKENFFSEPNLPVDSEDRTVLIGEDTGYMDMTCSHTVEFNKEDTFDPKLIFKMSNVNEPHKLNSQNGMTCKTVSSVEKEAVRSQFSDFLSCLSNTKAQDVATSFPKKNKDHFTLENISNVIIDKENFLPSGLTTLSLPATDNMDITREEKEAFQHFTYSVDENYRSTNTMFCSNFDDMELTQQTNTINLKGLDNPNHSMSSVDQKKFACDDTSEMIMTEVLDEYVQDQNRTNHVQSNMSFADVQMDVSQTAASKPGECKRNMPLATPTVIHNEQSDFMDLTCQAPTGVLSHVLDGSVFTESSNMAIEPKHISETNVMSKPQASSKLLPSASLEVKRADPFKSELSLSHMVGDPKKTCCLVGDDLEKTHHTVSDDMEMTLCQTVLETKSCDDYKPSDKSKKRVSLASTSFKTKGLSPEHTGHMELSRYSFSKRTKTENCVVPTAPKFLLQDVSNCMELQQDTASHMTVTEDDMEMTRVNTVNFGTETSWLTSPSYKTQSAPCVISSRPTIDQMKRSEANLGTVPASQTVDCSSSVSVMDLDAGNCKMVGLARDQTIDTTAHHNSKPSCSNSANEQLKTEEFSEEDSNMEFTTVNTAPLKEQCCVAFNQEEMARETVETVPATTDQKICIETESDIDTLKKEDLSSVKPRRRSLADLKLRLQNISQYISEQDGLLPGSVTAPVPSFTAVSPVEKHSELDNSLQPFKETQLLGNKLNTPFSLKNSLMARLSVGGIMPKFPPRAGSAQSNQTDPKSPNNLQDLQLQTCFNADVQNGSYETDLIDDVLPEDDFSDALVSYMSKSKVEEATREVYLNKDEVEYNHMEHVMNISQSGKMPPEVKDENTKDSSDKLWDNNCAAPNAPAQVVKTDDTNSTMMKFEGNSELTLRNSQLDSQIGGTMDHEFDFYEKLEEGSITVNEFLTHFGAKFVIHRSRPSALPDNFRAAQTYTMEDLLREKYIHRPKQKVYETDWLNLSEMAEGFKTQMADQDKPLGSINGKLLQDISAFSKEQLQRFGSKLKERRVYFRKRNKALSHKMKENLYSQLLKTTQEAKQSLTSKIKETNEMLYDLDGCINDLESELIGMNHIVMGDQNSLIRLEPALKAKQEQLDTFNSEVTEKEKQLCKLELQAQSLEDSWEKVQDETRELECQTTNLNSLNEWRFISGDKNGIVFSFLHNTVHLEVKHKKASGKEFKNDVDQDVDVSFRFLLNVCSQPSAIMVHKLLKENLNYQSKWKQKYLTTQSIPMLLHDVSVVVSRLRLLGEEIHRLKKWGGLRLGILHITCVDSLVEVLFSSVKAFVKFELSLAVTPDYPFRPLQLQKFQNHIGNTRLEQIKDIVSSVRPAKNYLTTVMKRIHSNLLG